MKLGTEARSPGLGLLAVGLLMGRSAFGLGFGTEVLSPSQSPDHQLVNGRVLTLQKAIGVRSKDVYRRTMGGGTYWYENQPVRSGPYVWDDFDATIAVNSDNCNVIWQAYKAPAWADELPPDQFITEFAKYVAAGCERYNGRIVGVNIWNEPGERSFGCLATNATEAQVMVFYDKLVRACYKSIRAVNANVKILGPNFADLCSDAMLNQLQQLGTLAFFDWLSFHSYEGLSWMNGAKPGNRVDATDAFAGKGYWINRLHFCKPTADALTGINQLQPGKPKVLDEVGAFKGAPEQVLGLVMAAKQAGFLYVIFHGICVGPMDGRPDDPLWGFEADGATKRDNYMAVEKAMRLVTP